eukprot:TRINITY_DN2953_c1_g3_i2.p1 TRINITY_DN2953_c1_g3~~TRINITY_DN2953_c1_g3_i2.p1  ORF type:complete len:4397 (+),score=1399.38 TRINITY_DN2953_c1_g3_i2:1264-13191(+)
MPVWRKLYTCGGEGACGTRFEVAAEDVSWSALAAQALTWNYVRLQSLHTALDTRPRKDAVRLSPVTVYAATASFAGTECWGVAAAAAAFSDSSDDLHADPTTPPGAADDAVGATTAFATLYMPSSARSVCYRKEGGGWRVLGWAAPADAKWSGGAAQPSALTPTPAPLANATWSTNDARASTHGQMLLQGAAFDTRRSNFERQYGAGDSVLQSVGSALRLVPASAGCDWRNVSLSVAAGLAAESRDGGEAECTLAEVASDKPCLGAASDAPSAPSAAYYLTHPLQPGSYRVCLRQAGPGWQQIGGEITVLPAPAFSLQLSSLRAGVEVAVVIEDAGKGLSTADLVRLAPAEGSCGFSKAGLAADLRLVDTALSPYCAVDGRGNATYSGLASPPCSAAAWVAALPTESLRRYLNLTPAVYDDIVPSDDAASGLAAAAASVVTPTGGRPYKVCVKQANLTNWVVLNGTQPLRFNSTGSLKVEPAAGTELLGGEVQAFAVQHSPTRSEFYAKLVRSDPASGNDGCVRPPSGTEADAYASATNTHTTSAAAVHFSLVVPQEAGPHYLCVSGGGADDVHWERYGPYQVLGSRLSWWVDADNRPTNLASVLLRIRRGGAEALDTSKGGDAVKLVRRQETCRSESAHVGAKVDAASDAAGNTDLGPDDRTTAMNSDATAVVVLPATAGDASVQYRVCVKTSFGALRSRPPSDRKVWVEVPQRRSGAAVVSGGFVTQPAGATRYAVADQLKPAMHMAPSDGVAVLAGASTRVSLIGNGGPSAAEGVGLTVHLNAARASVAGDTLKLVKVSSGESTGPVATASSTWTWGPAEHSDACLGEAVSVAAPAAALSVAGATVTADLHFPSATGGYLVCYRRARSAESVWGEEPWLTLPMGNGEYLLYSTSPGLGFSAPVAEDTVQLPTVTLHDDAAVQAQPRGPATNAGSWCGSDGAGAVCAGAYSSDLAKVVPAGTNCGLPAVGDAGWSTVSRTTNSTAEVNSGGPFLLPPSLPPAEPAYSICYFKAGQLTEGVSGWVAKAGVVYILQNVGVRATGGGSPSYFAQSVQPGAGVTSIAVGTSYPFNSSVSFTVFSPADLSYYRSLDTSWYPSSPAIGPSTSPITGQGDVIAVRVQFAAAGATPIAFGSYPVQVQQCPASASWDDGTLLCASNGVPGRAAEPLQSINEFKMGAPNACPPEYGWGTDGLRAMSSSGAASFDIQLLSCCPLKDNLPNAGCGFKFVAREPGTGTTFGSLPIWMNKESVSPDSLLIDSQPVYPRHTPALPKESGHSECGPTHPSCFMKVCRDRRMCSIQLQSTGNGQPVHCPRGGVSLTFSTFDYGKTDDRADKSLLTDADFEATSWGEVVDDSWAAGGEYRFSRLPVLRPGRDVATVFYNVTYGAEGAGWTRFAVRVERPVPHTMHIVDIAPLPMPLNGTEPAPTWQASEADHAGHAFPSASPEMTADAGAHLLALHPYTLLYRVLDADGVPIDHTDGWSVSVAVKDRSGRDAEGNSVLRVVMADGVPSVHNLLSAPSFAQELGGGDPQPAGNLPQHHSATGVPQPAWKVSFRILNSVGCSRLVGDGTGCIIRVSLQKQGLPAVSAQIRTPVRVRAAGVMVTSSSATSTVSEGISVTVVPGVRSPAGWLADEYHFGDAFALIGEHDGINTADGASFGSWDRDGTLLPLQRSMQLIELADSVFTWGAKWQLRPDRPCTRCRVTFNTRWGAGPLPDAEPLHLTWTSSASRVECLACYDSVCSPHITVPMREGYPSDRFDILMRVVDDAGHAEVWPRWQARLDAVADKGSPPHFTAVDVTTGQLSPDPAERQPMLDAFGTEVAMMQHGVANFSGVYVAQRDSQRRWGRVRMGMHTVGQLYSAEANGSVVLTGIRPNCTVDVTLEQVHSDVSERSIAVTSAVSSTADGVQSALQKIGCDGDESCSSFSAPLGERITLTMQFMVRRSWADGAGSPDREDRNVTVEAGGVPARWHCSGPTGGCTAEPMLLKSPQPDIVGVAEPGATPVTYSFGTAALTFRRSKTSYSSAPGGLAFVGIDHGGASEPARAVSFKVCASRLVCDSTQKGCTAAGEDGEVPDESQVPCQPITLWIVAAQRQLRAAIVATSLKSAVLRPGAPTCRTEASLITLTALAFYTLTLGNVDRNFVAYDVPISFHLAAASSQGTQLLVPAADPLAVNQSLISANEVSSDASPAAALALPGNRSVTFSFYGVSPLTGVTFQVAAHTRSAAGVETAVGETVSTAMPFSFADDNDTFDSFNVHDDVASDEECPERRHMPVVASGYLAYKPVPGRTWSTSEGARVGVPHPIHVSVGTSSDYWVQRQGTEHGCPTTAPTATVAGAALKECQRLCSDNVSCAAVAHGPSGCRLLPAAAGALDGDPTCSYWEVRRGVSRRAWSFPRTMVTVRLRLPDCCETGTCRCCGTGGDSLRVYTLPPSDPSVSGVQMRPANVSSFELRAEGCRAEPCFAGHLISGAATVWVVFAEPCEQCQLELTLCSASATPAEAALCTPSAPATDNLLPAAHRTVRASVRVLPPDPTHVVVHDQTLPAAASSSVLTGAAGVLRFKAVQSFGDEGWAVDAASDVSYQVWVAARAVAVGAPQYSNGGFIAKPDGETLPQPCGVTEGQVAGASRLGATLSVQGPASDARLVFYFTRPCTLCELRAHYSMVTAAGTVRTAGFQIREYGVVGGGWAVGGVARLQVETCHSRWAFGAAPPSARRRRPFAVAVLSADQAGFPTRRMNGTTTLHGVDELSTGNGGGGELLLHSPSAGRRQSGAWDLPVVDGVATAVLSYTRACWRCVIASESETADLAVLTEPTQLVVQPVRRDHTTFTFEVFAADDLLDRSYLVGGPTVLQWQRVYSQLVVSSARLTVPQMPESRLQIGSAAVLVSGGPTFSITSGGRMSNGVPFTEIAGGQALPGVLVMEAAGSPGVDTPVGLQVAGADLKVRQFGGSVQPLDVSVAYDRAAIVGSWESSAHTAAPGEAVNVTVYAIGPVPGSAGYVRSVDPVDGDVVVAVRCSGCADGCFAGGPAMSFSTVRGGFTRGVASLWLQVYATAGVCELTITVPPALSSSPPVTTLPCNGTGCSLTVTSTAVDLSQWVWTSTDSFSARSNDGGPPTPQSPRAEGEALGKAPVLLALRACTDDGYTPPRGVAEVLSDWDATGFGITADPPGCFVPTGVSTDAHTVLLSGQFNGHGACTVGGTGATGLPAGSLSQPLRVEIQEAAAVRVLPLLLPVVAGSDAAVRVETVTPAGERCRGDGVSTAMMMLRRAVAGGTETIIRSAAAKRGLITLPLHLHRRTGGTPWNLTVLATLPKMTVAEGSLVLVPGGWGPCAPNAQAGAAPSGTQLKPAPQQHADSSPCGENDSAASLPEPDAQVGVAGLVTGVVHAVTGSAAKVLAGGQYSDGCATALTPVEAVPAASRVDVVVAATDLAVQVRVGGGSWQDTRLRDGEQVRRAARGVVGVPMELCASAVDNVAQRNVPMGIEAGSAARFAFRSVSVPCKSADLHTLWVRDTCSPTGACLPSPIPDCGGGDWSFALQPSAHLERLEASLAAGRLALPQIVYTGREGLVRFALTTDDFTRSNGSSVHPAAPRVFMNEMYFQATASLNLEVTNASDTINCVSTSPSVRVCSLSARPWYRAFIPGTSVEKVAYDSASSFGLRVELLDVRSDVVTADNHTRVLLSARCVGDGHVMLYVDGVRAQRDDGEGKVVPVTGGVAVFNTVSLEGSCAAAVVAVTCVNGTTAAKCSALNTTTEPFEVVAVHTPEPGAGSRFKERLHVAASEEAALLWADRAVTVDTLRTVLCDSVHDVLHRNLAVQCKVAALCFVPLTARGAIEGYFGDADACWAAPTDGRRGAALQQCSGDCEMLADVEVRSTLVGLQGDLSRAVDEMLLNPYSKIRLQFPSIRPASAVVTVSPAPTPLPPAGQDTLAPRPDTPSPPGVVTPEPVVGVIDRSGAAATAPPLTLAAALLFLLLAHV